MSSGVDVVTIGESMVLFQSLQDGPLAYAPLFTKTIAGAESNVAIGLVRLGMRVRWISRLGTDPFGKMIETALAGEGVDVSCVIHDDTAPTAIYFKEILGYGDPNVYYYRRGSAASRLSPEEIRPEWFTDAKHLHVTGITPALGPATADAVRCAMELARKQGLTISFDPNLRRKLWDEAVARKTLLSLVPLCDLFMPGMEEAEFLLGTSDPDEAGRSFLEMGANVVALKRGPAGSVGYVAGARVEADAVAAARVADTVGAGDAFAAGMLSVLAGHPLLSGKLSAQEAVPVLTQALRRGNRMGSIAVQFRGDWEGLPSLAELERDEAGQSPVTR
jgi:2-dehydro-3-deoxygluconokinase